MSSSVVQAITKQADNQQRWDEFAENIKKLNDYSAELEGAIGK